MVVAIRTVQSSHFLNRSSLFIFQAYLVEVPLSDLIEEKGGAHIGIRMGISSQKTSAPGCAQVRIGESGISMIIGYRKRIGFEVIHLFILPVSGVADLAVLGSSSLIRHRNETGMDGMYGLGQWFSFYGRVAGRPGSGDLQVSRHVVAVAIHAVYRTYLAKAIGCGIRIIVF